MFVRSLFSLLFFFQSFSLGFLTCLLGSILQASAGKLIRTFRRGPKAASSKKGGGGVCHLCLAGQPEYDFEDMTLGGILRINKLFVRIVGIKAGDCSQYPVVSMIISCEECLPAFHGNP